MSEIPPNELFEAEQSRHAEWRRRHRDATLSDAEARMFEHLASEPTPEFPPEFTASVVRIHRRRAREAAHVAAWLGAVAGLGALACVAIALPALSLQALVAACEAFGDSHAMGAFAAVAIASALSRKRCPKARARTAT